MQQMIKDQAKEFYETKAEIQKREEAWQLEKGLLTKDLTDTLKIIDQLKAEQVRLEEQKNEEIRRLKEQLQERKEEREKPQFPKEEFPPLSELHVARPFMEAEIH
ncbi:unnamed protein product [Lactuca virosa]|nr:unnamed protein product [Lactuca virosa]